MNYTAKLGLYLLTIIIVSAGSLLFLSMPKSWMSWSLYACTILLAGGTLLLVKLLDTTVLHWRKKHASGEDSRIHMEKEVWKAIEKARKPRRVIVRIKGFEDDGWAAEVLINPDGTLAASGMRKIFLLENAPYPSTLSVLGAPTWHKIANLPNSIVMLGETYYRPVS